MTRTSDQIPPRPAEQLRADARQNHARLIAAATTAFAERGADAPLEDIARRAGVGIGTLYRHFPTRLDLQAAVFRSQVGAVCGEGDALLEKAPPGEAFSAWMRSLAGYLVTKRGLSHALIEAVGIESELISSCWMAMRQTTERLLANAQEAGVIRTDVDAMDVMRLVHGVAVSTEKAPERSDMLLSVMLDGLRVHPLYGVDVPAMLFQLHEWDIHIVCRGADDVGRTGGAESGMLSDGGGAVFEGGTEDDGGAGGDAADGADLLEQVFQRGGRGHPHLEDVVLVAGDAVAGLDGR
jgi:AcrR family transcriptional regulator